MQRTRFSKILQTDLTDIPERIPGNHILQSHGNSVSRGDLITQENISTVPLPWTITINKDTFSSLCTVGNPGSLPSLYGGDYVSNSQMAVDSDGIYVSSYGTDPGGDGHARYHGPFFYTFFPTQVGNPGQYLYVKVKDKTNNLSQSNVIFPVFIRVGFSFLISYYYAFNPSSTKFDVSFYNSTTNNYNSRRTESFPSNTMAVHEFKFYHYTNNTYKTYLDGVIKRNENDPIALDTPQNSLTCGIFQYFEGHDYATPYFRLQELIISTDPSYDPQP